MEQRKSPPFVTFDDYSFPFFGTRRKKKKSLLHFCSFSIIQRVNFSGGVNISLSLSQKAQPKKHQEEEKHHTISHTSLLYTQIQKSIVMEELKASGNAAFKKGDFASAVDFFSRAIDASSKNNNIENHHVLYSNRSAARVRRIIVVFLFISSSR